MGIAIVSTGVAMRTDHFGRCAAKGFSKMQLQVTVSSLYAQIFVEYVMLHKINDSPETAHELGQLLKGRNMIVNLIPWNPVYSPGMQLKAPGDERVAEFQRIVREHYGIFCTVRQEMGQDISGNVWGQ